MALAGCRSIDEIKPDPCGSMSAPTTRARPILAWRRLLRHMVRAPTG